MIQVVVLDMDETLGVSVGDVFHARPYVDFLIEMLRCMDVDVILWSLGEDTYVQSVVNESLPLVASYAYKVFARKEAKTAMELYGYCKSGDHIRDLYEENIFLVGVDDQVSTNMDSSYDVRIHVPPYNRPDKSDSVIWQICDKIVKNISLTRDLTPLQR